MYERFFPSFFFDRVADIPKGFFYKNKIKFAVLDIDNTLVPYTEAEPSDSAKAFLTRLEEEGIKYCFLSNNSKKRVDIFNKNINAPYVSNGKKPLAFGIKKAMTILGAKPVETILIGDQIFTDVWCANRVGARSVLVLPIEDKETAFFKIKRAFERVVLKKYKMDKLP